VNGAPGTARVVVKLGGSLAGDPSLAHWLRELALSPSARFVVVPGGGPFADAVRAAQNVWHFSDETAHAMAIGAMDLFGRMLCGIETGSIPCSTPSQFEDAWSRGQLPVWLPGIMMMAGEVQLPRSWDVTSDTIAAWLAEALRADGLLLVKSCQLPADLKDPAVLAAAGVVDPALPGVVSRSGIAFHVVQRERWSELSRVVTRFSGRV
jgi:aspartokinase-like uncharacterized kinase